MTDFDFCKEMVYGRKHINQLKFDHQTFDFRKYLLRLFNVNDLSELHNIQKEEYKLFTEFGKDSNTEFHKKFYEYLKSLEGEYIKEQYIKFVKEIIMPYLGLKKALVQKFPTMRFQLPNNVAVARKHTDSEIHPIGEINFIYAFTDMHDTNAVWIEKMPRSEEYVPLELKAGECVSFNANLCSHYNKINNTDKTRVSMDFRVLPLNYYNESDTKKSTTTNNFYKDGGYYTMIEVS